MVAKQRIAFVSTLWTDPWGGSEELWSRTALDLLHRGFAVSASVSKVSRPHDRLLKLAEAGVEIQMRPLYHPARTRAWRKVFANGKAPTVIDLERFIAAHQPSLVVFSAAGPLPPVEMLEICIAKSVPFVTIGHTNWEGWWPDDETARRYQDVISSAHRCYFVSMANQRLTEKEIGCEFSNAEIIWSPVNVDFNALPPWPALNDDNDLRLACVGRLHPPSKGQDILLEALASPIWRGRNWRLTLYGEGPMRHCLDRMVRRLGLQDRVAFAGQVSSVENIWAENHVLVMPSRAEGLPLAVLEAMLCARPVLATDVAGHSEVIDDGLNGFLADAPTGPSVAKALERLWADRMNLEGIGRTAAKRIRERMPADPVQVFSEKIIDLVCRGDRSHAITEKMPASSAA
jgi:glycosyltransferase involved in cell wall biosynthesis